MKLVLERRDQENKTGVGEGPNTTIYIAPLVDEDYWAYRVRLSETQAIVGFPKFTTIGIGFTEEEDWNSNLPFSTSAEDIFNHISHNKGDDSISDEDVLTAIQMVREAVAEDRGVGLEA